MCSMWDVLSYRGPPGDGHAARTCGEVEPSLVRAGVVPEVQAANFASYRERLASRKASVAAWRLGDAPPAPPPQRWLVGRHDGLSLSPGPEGRDVA